MNEGGISTPFIVRWPGQVKPGTMTGQLGHIIDVLPTCLELAGGKPLAEINGAKDASRSKATACCRFCAAERARRRRNSAGNGPATAPSATANGNSSGTRSIKPKKWELYDIEADRTELHNLADAKPELVKELSAAYEKWAKATGRKLPGAKGKKSKDD